MKKNKKWEGISLYQKIADINMKKKKIDKWQFFKTCLKSVKNKREECLEYDCVIAKLILALERRGARI